MRHQGRTHRHGLTLVEVAVALLVFAMIAAAAAVTVRASLDRADQGLADATIDRVVTAQLSYASGRGAYAWGVGGDDDDLRSRLPEALARDVALTHDQSRRPDVASVAVGEQGTLTVAVALPNGRCRYRSVGAPSAQRSGSAAEAGTALADEPATSPRTRCVASQLLPSGETAIWE
jgi:prepilin-type N-terminal cleavage/methylation domain-containing protein